MHNRPIFIITLLAVLSLQFFSPPAVAVQDLAGPDATALETAAVAPRLNLVDAMILGTVEGLTEYLPVSSTGHLILTSYFLKLSRFVPGPENKSYELVKAPGLDAFQIVIQAGAILAVLGIFRKRVAVIIHGVLGRNPDGLQLLLKLLLAFFPAAVIGLLSQDLIKEYLFSPHTVAIALAVGGLVMISINRCFYNRYSDTERTHDIMMLTWRQALIIGLFQCLALCPGTSRSMVTILGGIIVGLDMVTAAEFSFLLALPTLGAATVYEGFKEFSQLTDGIGWPPLLVGIIVSGAVAALTVKWLIFYLHKHGLAPFGVYRITLAIVVTLVFL